MWRLIKSLLLVIVLLFVVRHVARSWNSLIWPEELALSWLFSSFLLGILGLVLFAFQSQWLVNGNGYEIDLPQSIGLTYVPMLGKYVPGKLFSILLGLHIYSWLNVPSRIAAECIAFSMLLGVASGFCVAAVMEPNLLALGGWPGFSVLAATCCLALQPKWFAMSANRVLRVMRRVETLGILSRKVLWGALGLNAAAWMVYGAGFFCLVRSVSQVPAEALGQTIAVFVFAQIAGMLALFAPAGIGVREVVFVVLLGSFLGNGVAVIIAGLARIWQTSLELMLAAFGWWVLKQSDPVEIVPPSPSN